VAQFDRVILMDLILNLLLEFFVSGKFHTFFSNEYSFITVNKHSLEKIAREGHAVKSMRGSVNGGYGASI
jgi:hypothetical protein